MRMIQTVGALTLALVVAACGGNQSTATQNQAVASGASEAAAGPIEVYSGTGTVQSINGDQVAIAHGPIRAVGWPAMTMTFTAPPDIAPNAKVGAKVDFSFSKQGSAYVLTSVKSR